MEALRGHARAVLRSHGQVDQEGLDAEREATAANPDKTARYIEKLLEKGKPTAFCTHRPVLPTILRVFAEHAPKRVAQVLPTEDPYLKPGEILVAYVRPGTVARIVEIERFRPIDA